MGTSTVIRFFLGLLFLMGSGEQPPADREMAYYAQGLVLMDPVLKEHDFAFIGAAALTDTVHLQLRKRHDPMDPTSEAEIQTLKEAIYKEYHLEFPLEIDVWRMPETPSVEGKITGIDSDRLLVTGLAEDSKAEPRAMWLRMVEDTVLLNGKTGEPISWEQLKIGFKVRAWSGPVVKASYPGQSELLRLEVVEPDKGDGDLQGTITKIGIGIEDTTARELQIDGKSYLVLPTAVFRNGDREAKFEELKEGDRVAVWFIGYSIYPGELMITQVVATP